jgi:hypothetical protein
VLPSLLTRILVIPDKLSIADNVRVTAAVLLGRTAVNHNTARRRGRSSSVIVP